MGQFMRLLIVPALLLKAADGDASRKLQPEGPLWTFLDLRVRPMAANKGMRLDHFLLSLRLCSKLLDGGGRRPGPSRGQCQQPRFGWIELDA
jgi:exodeoxyribonuclease III